MEGFFRLSLTLFERRQNTSQPWSTQDGTGGYLDFVQVCSTSRTSPVRLRSRYTARSFRCELLLLVGESGDGRGTLGHLF